LSSRDVRPSGKASSISLNWSSGDGCLEEVSTSSGRRKDSGTPSRLCRHSLFTRWLQLQRQLNGPASGSQASTESFSACKISAGRYQRALQRFGSALKAGGLGAWYRKPLKSGHFSVTNFGSPNVIRDPVCTMSYEEEALAMPKEHPCLFQK
ncbi:Double-stranded RNA-specific editase 1, partial [Oryzias melastigma]